MDTLTLDLAHAISLQQARRTMLIRWPIADTDDPRFRRRRGPSIRHRLSVALRRASDALAEPRAV